MYRWNFKHAGIENSEEYINQSEEKIKQDCESNAKKIVKAGRNRWKIENQGFNRQKHWQGNIEHAQMNHYLMEQIADFIKQLYEYYYLKKNEIKKLQKNISPELLASFGRQLTKTEDIKVELAESINSCQ